ncbi:MAG: hypothetical protein PHU82_00570 [Candidatus Pacebacteria bacterium]|jgi:hypothetical protein|nr:hypothetical protein [Candidatus Paceibacterota bacterium]MDD4994471.1 hypothetical protein [Candidatus Paceibacterota bacterium]MDD5535124.1 hypothetical protein [Candidatus Paceibacterota bacterium]
MSKLTRDFVSEEPRDFKFKIGTTIASSLSGFIAGVFATLIFLAIILYFLKVTIQIGI